LGKKEETPWREGKHALDGEDTEEWEFSLDCKEQDMSRPHGEPERIWILVVLEGIKWKVYAMIDRRDFVRVRSKGALDIHVSGSVYNPIPKDPWKIVIKVVSKELILLINGIKCDKGCGHVGDAKLEKIVISPDPGRPAGFKWRNPVLTKGGAQ
jgi:hypothetical protein